MFLLVSTSTLSVASIFIPGSPFMKWILNEDDETSEIASETFEYPQMQIVVNIKEDVENNSQGYPSNLAHISLLMVGIILARFGRHIQLRIPTMIVDVYEFKHISLKIYSDLNIF